MVTTINRPPIITVIFMTLSKSSSSFFHAFSRSSGVLTKNSAYSIKFFYYTLLLGHKTIPLNLLALLLSLGGPRHHLDQGCNLVLSIPQTREIFLFGFFLFFGLRFLFSFFG